MISYFQDYDRWVNVRTRNVFVLGFYIYFFAIKSKPTPEKLKSYECGVDPVGRGWSQTYVRYYIFGLLFVIFDVEAVFIFPWALNLENLGYLVW